ncbi:NADP-dependent 3-hydroxy acid dehydrogenase YdfG [Nocardia tenerifensis]|uniref:NADP-dependent 3-hydroxy acid dehydrogenase YdfG n=1 Tax=Nocardia tenerifensis TaxID=228006 RepID=A0A318K1M4_9NOCA|nr:SDR family NAD(P)-dependent oxidoreductase [Nocardia tenerifensis]PXX61575.1 NADP-dependent 3-hydroxy acid dehydrogenase YdfG [Nocardia tenerifensis]
MSAPVLLVLGAGPGVGLAVARLFADDGYAVFLACRLPEEAEPLAAQLRGEGFDAEGVGVDLSDPADIARVVTAVGEQHGQIDVLHFNPSMFRQADPLELSVPELIEDFTIGAAALLPAVQAALPFFAEGARVLVTGSAAADKPWHRAASLGVQKAAVRNLVTSLDTTLAPKGIRAVAVQINGVLDEGAFTRERVAEALHAAAVRPLDDWTPHTSFNG